MSAASARMPTPMLSTPMKAMNCQASRTFFSAFLTSVGSVGRVLPAVIAQLAAEEASSVGPAALVGACQTWGCRAGATAPTAAHMSQALLPIGLAQPHVLQTAMDLYRSRRAELP